MAVTCALAEGLPLDSLSIPRVYRALSECGEDIRMDVLSHSLSILSDSVSVGEDCGMMKADVGITFT